VRKRFKNVCSQKRSAKRETGGGPGREEVTTKKMTLLFSRIYGLDARLDTPRVPRQLTTGKKGASCCCERASPAGPSAGAKRATDQEAEDISGDKETRKGELN